MQLVYDAKNWKKWWSMRFIIISAFFQAIPLAYATLPDDWMPSIPGWVKLGFAAGALGCAGLAGVSRVIQQAGLQDDASMMAKVAGKAVGAVENVGK